MNHLFASALLGASLFFLLGASPGAEVTPAATPSRPAVRQRPPLAMEAKVGGRVSPLGTEIQVDLPGGLHKANIASKGLGCCVFRSLDHAARWQNVPALWGMPEWMVAKGVAGGGYPAKVDKLIPEIAKDRGLPTPQYLQHEGTDLELVLQALKTGRMVSGTYGRSPTGRYRGQHIDHMVNYVHLDSREAAVLDNNYPGPEAYEWMTPAELLKAAMDGYRQLWVVILLDNPPPPPPRNK